MCVSNLIIAIILIKTPFQVSLCKYTVLFFIEGLQVNCLRRYG